MASLCKTPQFVFLDSVLAGSVRPDMKRSTKSKDRKEAQRLADEWETLARGQHPTVRAGESAVTSIYERATAESMPAVTLDRYIAVWLANGLAVRE